MLNFQRTSPGQFSGEPLTRWIGPREMILEEALTFTDKAGKIWESPKGACLNGATIPRGLWTLIGSPYTGKYRRASVIHDRAVGELCNPDINFWGRFSADRMFHEACLVDGCSDRFARMLYIGVRIGSWMSLFSGRPGVIPEPSPDSEAIDDPSFVEVREKFEKAMSATNGFVEPDLDAVDKVLNELLPIPKDGISEAGK